jgi:hypothetical protein
MPDEGMILSGTGSKRIDKNLGKFNCTIVPSEDTDAAKTFMPPG